ncbi:TPA: hypothetical protein J2F96_002768 [Escherichia coli]|nr:hypothetical protein [Escherichia coli]
MFPAPAGINRGIRVPARQFPGVPRASGDKPITIVMLTAHSSCSPRQRG